ncbi:MAG: tripartite tricarboxylate transporter TctB family protein [Gammaproteobacteria bacterium]|nr:tripartite tricarboxylate transporter TctB family protein [Gammaproteobacteria bacterium]
MKARIYTIPALLTVFSMIVIWLSFQLDISPPMIVGDSMQPRAFPIFLMILNLILVGLLTLQLRRSPPDKKALEPIATWGSMSLMLLFYLLTTYVDMFIAIAVCMFLMCLLWGERRWWAVIGTSLVTPAAIFLLFDSVLRIRFPRGLFTNWWYS